MRRDSEINIHVAKNVKKRKETQPAGGLGPTASRQTEFDDERLERA